MRRRFLCAALFAAAPASAQSLVTVDAGSNIGDSPLSELMCALHPWPHPFLAADEPMVQAWNESGIRYMRGIVFFEGCCQSIDVTRQPGGGVDLDFTYFDLHLNGIRDFCPGTRPIFDAIFMPQALSAASGAPDYFNYTAADLNEWYQVIYQVVDHTVQLGFPGAIYEVWSEPDGPDTFAGHPDRPGDTLGDFVDFYVFTYHAIKDADPSALVAGPKAGSYDSVRIGGLPWGLPEFLAALEAWNQAHPQFAAAIDILTWHDYIWESFAVGYGADQVDAMVASVGVPSLTFPSWPPYMLGEWNYGFSFPVDPMLRQAYLVHNYLREADPRTRRFHTLGIYSFHLGGEPDNYSDLVEIDAFGNSCSRPPYAGMQMLQAMQAGYCLDAVVDDPGAGAPQVAALATCDGQAVRVMVSNPRDEPQTVSLYLYNLPSSGWRLRQVQRIGAGRSEGCEGLESGKTTLARVRQGQYFMQLQLAPYGSGLVTLQQ